MCICLCCLILCLIYYINNDKFNLCIFSVYGVAVFCLTSTYFAGICAAELKFDIFLLMCHGT